MADKKPLVNSAGNAVEIATGDTIGIANGGTGAATKGGAVANLLAQTVTLANCSNTASEITVMSVTIPANTWADGEEVSIALIANHKQNNGVGSVNITYKVKVNATSLTTLSASAVANSATQGTTRRTLFFTRIGSDVYYTGNGSYGDMFATASLYTAAIATSNIYGSGNGNIFTSVDFTSNVTLTFTVQWASANANVYWNPIWAKCRKQ